MSTFSRIISGIAAAGYAIAAFRAVPILWIHDQINAAVVASALFYIFIRFSVEFLTGWEA